MQNSNSNLTEWLGEWAHGKPDQQVIAVAYEQLHRLAHERLRHERPNHTLQTTALVNEAYVSLLRQRTNWVNREQFFGIAARLMRRILVEYARKRGAAKRQGTTICVTLDPELDWSDGSHSDVESLDDALAALERLDQQQARIVELRFFTGLNVEDTAAALGISPRTVKREWRLARAWLRGQLSKGRAE